MYTARFPHQHIAAICALLLTALMLPRAVDGSGRQPQRFALGCFNCAKGTGTERHFPRAFIELTQPMVDANTDVTFEVFDIGDGSQEGVEASFSTLVVKNFTLVVLEPLGFTEQTVHLLSRVHAIHPTFRAILMNNDFPEDTNLPWLAVYGTRFDELGYLVGYIAGELTKAGRVAIVSNSVAKWWLARAIVSGYIVGVQDSCPRCTIDLQFEGSMFNPTHPEQYTRRGADVTAVPMIPEGVAHIAMMEAVHGDNSTYVPYLYDYRHLLSDDAYRRSPYDVVFELIQMAIEQMAHVAADHTDFRAGTFFLSAEQGAMKLLGCRKYRFDEPSKAHIPCDNANVPPVVQEAVELKYRQMLNGAVSTGTTTNADASLSSIVFPSLRAFEHRALTPVGDRARWSNPVPIVLGSFKIALWSPPFTDLWSYIYFADAMTHFPPKKDFLTSRVNFAAASFDTYTLLFGGQYDPAECTSNCVQAYDELVRVQHNCNDGGPGAEESCTINPEATQLPPHPGGGRVRSCVARLGNDTLFVFGGATASGAVSDEVYLYNVRNRTWKVGPRSGTARQRHTCTQWRAESDSNPLTQCVLVVGGTNTHGEVLAAASLFCLDAAAPSGGRWQATSGLGPTALLDPCVFATQHRMYLFGGDVNANHQLVANASNSSSGLWVLTPSFEWHNVDFGGGASRRDGKHGRDTREPMWLPSGAQRCVVTRQLGERPDALRGVAAAMHESVNTYHRVYVFGLRLEDGKWVGSSDAMHLLTFPWITCAGGGLTLSADGFACIDAHDGDRTSGPALMVSTPTLVGIVVGVVVGALLLAAIPFVVYRYIQGRRLQRAMRFVPQASLIAMATVQIRAVQNPEAGYCPGIVFSRISDKLRRIATGYRIYEAQRFGNSYTYACDNPAVLFQAVSKQFQFVHREFPRHGCSVAASLHFAEISAIGKPTVATKLKCTFEGSIVRHVHEMASTCPDGALVISQKALAHIPERALDGCDFGESVTIADGRVNSLILEPELSRKARNASRDKAVRLTVEGVSERSMLHADRVEPLRREFSTLFLSELFRRLRKASQREFGDRLVNILRDRYQVPPQKPTAAVLRRGTKASSGSIRHNSRTQALIQAIVRELYEPLVAVQQLNASGSRLHTSAGSGSESVEVVANPLSASGEDQQQTADQPRKSCMDEGTMETESIVSSEGKPSSGPTMPHRGAGEELPAVRPSSTDAQPRNTATEESMHRSPSVASLSLSDVM